MPTIATRFLKTYYEVTGETGTPLVLVNGLGSDLNVWDLELREALSAHHQCVAFDNRGVGRSAVPADGYSIAQFARDAVALFDALGLDRVHLLGSSMGGLIAQEIAIQAPDRLLSLTLGSTFAGFTHLTPAAQDVITVLLESGRLEPAAGVRLSWTISFEAEFIAREREWLERKLQREIRYRCSPEVHGKHFLAAAEWDGADRLRNVRVPTFLLTGENDVLVPPVNSETLRDLLPAATLRTYPNAGHGVLTEQLDTVVADILAHTAAHDPVPA